MAETPPEQGSNARSPAPRHSLAWEILATLGAIFLALGWVAFSLPLQSPGSAPPPGTPPHLRIERIDALTTDPSGRLYRRLRADELQRMTRARSPCSSGPD